MSVKLLNGDCLELMGKIPDHSIDMILCDLPYGTTSCEWDTIIPFDKLWNQYERLIKKHCAIVLFGTEPFTSKLIMSNIKMYREKLTWVKHRPTNFGNAKTMHLKYSEDIIVFGKGPVVYNPQYITRVSPRVKQAQAHNTFFHQVVKDPKNAVSFKSNYGGQSPFKLNAEKKFQGNVITCPAVQGNSKEKVNHPTQKPIRLISYLLSVYSNEGGGNS